MTTKEAVEHLCSELLKDSGYYDSWKANIAMSFKDEFYRSYLNKGIHEISNNAAENFLDMLCRTINKESEGE